MREVQEREREAVGAGMERIHEKEREKFQRGRRKGRFPRSLPLK